MNPNNKAPKTNENTMQSPNENCLDDRFIAGILFPENTGQSGD